MYIQQGDKKKSVIQLLVANYVDFCEPLWKFEFQCSRHGLFSIELFVSNILFEAMYIVVVSNCYCLYQIPVFVEFNLLELFI